MTKLDLTVILMARFHEHVTSEKVLKAEDSVCIFIKK